MRDASCVDILFIAEHSLELFNVNTCFMQRSISTRLAQGGVLGFPLVGLYACVGVTCNGGPLVMGCTCNGGNLVRYNITNIYIPFLNKK